MWRKIQAEPFLAAATLLLLVTVVAGGGQVMYWKAWQEGPSMVNTVPPYTTSAANLQARKSATAAATPVTTFKNGETWYRVHPNVCYAGKAGAVVTRAYIGVGANAGIIYPLPDRQPPTRTLGCALKVFTETVPLDLPAGPWIHHMAVNFYKNPIQPAIRITHPDVTITVVK